MVLSPLGLKSFHKVFLFHKSNTCGNSCILTNSYQPCNFKPDNCFTASGIFSIVSLVRSLSLYILSHFIFLLHRSRFLSRHARGLQSEYQPLNKDNFLSTALGFPIAKRITNHCSILLPKAVSFSQELMLP